MKLILLRVLTQIKSLLDFPNDHYRVINQRHLTEAISQITFLVAIAGTSCNALNDTMASYSCMSKHFYKQLIVP